MFKRLGAFYDVFRKGQAVADVVGLKNKQMLAAALASFLGGCTVLAKSYGINLPLDDQDLVYIGGTLAVIFGLFQHGATLASSDKVGLSGKSDSSDEPPMPAPIEDHSAALQPVSEGRSGTEDSRDVLAGLDTTYRGS